MNLKEYRRLFNKKQLLSGNFGIEREMLRVDTDGKLSKLDHPRIFGDKLANKYITTDFSESQIELITPTFNTPKEAYEFLESLYDIVAMEIGDEYLWSQSMPCVIPEENEIIIAKFCKCPPGESAKDYRRYLLKKYGGKIQLVSGIHYNFSFEESFLEKLYEQSKENISFKEFKNNIYLKVARNYLRYRWLLIYLLGGTSVIHESYAGECVKELQEVDKESFSSNGALSYRNSECGYSNKKELFPDYTSVEAYVNSLEDFVQNGDLSSPRELYSQIRLKGIDKDNISDSLLKEGVSYLEYRSIDINPFDKAGISLEDLEFISIFNLFLLIRDEEYDKYWEKEAFENQKLIAKFGQKEVMLNRRGNPISKNQWGKEILENIMEINDELKLGKDKIIKKMIEKVADYKLTYAYKIIDKVKKEGFVQAHMELSKRYKESAYNNRFKLKGYEDLELSTQILMKEAIKRGIEAQIIDRNENFIALKDGDRVEFVKQATKTSKDNYISVLAMENKAVTKKILEKANLIVPKSYEYNSFEEAISEINKFVNKKIVIKPKLGNFGVGISIFSKGSNAKDIKEALNIAFKEDDSVLVEEFVKGKEFRILVIDNDVVGVLHRVPANVLGDGKRTIRELVEIKNMNFLRGSGHKTPLEKIKLDKSVELFLKQSNLDFEYIPKKEELIFLRENSNISTGGDSIDFTDDIPKSFKNIAIEAAKAMNTKICGVDMIIENYKDYNSSYAIIEMNFNPAVHIHCYPYKGKERNIADKILKLLGFNDRYCN